MWSVFVASPVPTAVTRMKDGRILLANPACLEMLGWPQEEFVGRTMEEVGFWGSASRESMLAGVRSEGSVRDLEMEVVTKRGERLRVLTSISVVRLHGEQCLVGHIYDITARRRLEQELRESEDRFRQVTETLQQGFFLRAVDPPAVLYASPGMERIYGIALDVLTREPRALEALIHPDDRAEILARRDAMTEPSDHEFRIIRPDGETRWIRTRAEPVRSGGKITRIVAVSEDVTEARRLREALRESEERFRLLAENSSDVIMRSSPDGVIQYVSPASRSLYGHDPEEMIGRVRWDFVHPEDLAGLRSDTPGRAGSPDEVTNEYRVVRKDGGTLWVEAVSRALHDCDDDAVSGFHTSVRDISERKRSEDAVRRAMREAEQANEAKSEFLSRMSHELRTPLHAILGFGALLEREHLPTAQRDELAQLTRAGRHLLDLINEVLDLSRIERGELALSLEPVHVGLLVDEVLSMIAPLAVARAVTLAPAVAADLDLHVLADRQRLKQTLLNLLSNAVKYNREGGEVRVTVAGPKTQRARIEVVDTGIGIAADKLARAFEPFERLGAEAGEIEGTGLGLALTKRLVEGMGGAIGVASEIGVGTRFWLELPTVAAPDAQPASSARARPAGPEAVRGPPRTVLYVEDNPSNVKLVETIMGLRPEVTLLVATQGSLGVELAREHRPALVLLDLNLPDISGDEVLRRIRDDAGTADLRVVMVSADATSGQIDRLLAAGADDYLTKPFDIEQFIAVVDGAATSGRAARTSAPAADRAVRTSASPADRAVRTSAPPADASALDPERLERLRRVYPDAHALREFVELFLADAPDRLERVAIAARAGDAPAVLHAAHTLTGSCSLVGAARVGALVSEIANRARTGHVPNERQMEALRSAYEAAAAALVRELD